MLKKLRIKNFKCWQDTGEINLARMSLFFGGNSSGKSSIIQFLMMLKQTADEDNIASVFDPGSENSAVELGSHQNMVFHRDKNQNISFSYEYPLIKKLKIKDTTNGKEFSADHLSFNAEAGFPDKKQDAMVVKEFQYTLMNESKKNAFCHNEKKQKRNVCAKVRRI